MYEASAAEMSRPRQCVPLACVKYTRRPSRPLVLSDPLSEVRQLAAVDPLSEVRQLAAVSMPAATHVDSRSSHFMLPTGPSSPCSPSTSVASASCCTLGSAQFPMTNCLQQSAPLRTAATLQHNQCLATDSSITSPHTIGLASAVWSPMGASLQQAPQSCQVDRVQPASRAELLSMLAFHYRLMVSFNDEFSRCMNTIISVMHQACRAVKSHVFQYTFDRLRLLRFKYFQFAPVCNVYNEYQKNVRSNLNVTLPAVSCLQASIKIMTDSVNKVAEVFRQMQKWLSTDTRLTVTERGFVLANKVCHFAPVFMQEMSNFKRSLLMIIPEADASQSVSIASAVPSSVSSFSESSAATCEPVSSVVSQLQRSNNIELYAQDVEPILIAPMPIVIEPDGRPDDELALIRVKQEPAEVSQRRHRTLAELICVDDDDDSDAVGTAVGESDAVMSNLCDADKLLTVNPSSLEQLSAADSHLRTELDSSESLETSISVNDVLLTEVLGDISNSVDARISSDLFSCVSNVQTVVSDISGSAAMPASRGTMPCSSVTCVATECSASQLTVNSCDEMNSDLRNGSGSSVDNASHMGHTAAAAEHSLDSLSTTLKRTTNCSMNCESSELLNVTCTRSSLSAFLSQNSVDGNASCNAGNNESDVNKLQNARAECCDSNTVTEPAVSGMSNDLIKISSVCSVDLEGFESVDMTESTTVDDIVNVVRSFHENANIVFENVDLCTNYSCAQSFELSHLVPVEGNKEKAPASRFAESRTKKQQGEVLHCAECETSTGNSVSDNLKTVEDVCENDMDGETPHSAHDEKTVGSPAVTNVPGSSDKEHFENSVVACQDRNVEEMLPNGTTNITSKQLDASHYTGWCSESIEDVSTTVQPVRENSKTGLAEKNDSLSETCSELSAFVKTAVDTSAGSFCREATGLESGKHDSDESHAMDMQEEKCLKQPAFEGSDDLLRAVDEDRLKVPNKKKRARVVYDEENDENKDVQVAASVSVGSVQRTTKTLLQANNSKKVKMLICNKPQSMSFKLKEILHNVLEEQQSEKTVEKQAHRVQKRELVDKDVVTKVSQAVADRKQDNIATRMLKLKKSRKLLKRGVKQKSICLMNGSNVCKNINARTCEEAGDGQVQQRSLCRLPKSHRDVGTKTDVLPRSDNNTTEASSVSMVHSHHSEVPPKLSARDKINSIFKSSEFTRLHSAASLRHSERNKLPFPAYVSSSSKASEVCSECDARSVILLRKNSKISTIGCDRDIPESVVTSGSAAESSAVNRRPGKESSSVTVSAAQSDASVKTKVSGDRSSTASFGQKNQPGTSLLSQRKVCEDVVCSIAVGHSAFPSFRSQKSISRLQKVSTNVSSISHSLTRSQPSNISSAAEFRDPRLTQTQQMFGLEKCRNNAETPATSGVDVSGCALDCSGGSLHWPWEQTPAVASNLGSEQNGRNKQLADESTAGRWAWESGENSFSSHSSTMSVDVTDILSDLSAICSAEGYLQNASRTSDWHSASRVVHAGSFVSPSLHTSDDHRQTSDHDANATLSSDARYVIKSHKSSSSRTAKKPLSERMKCSGPPSDPRVKASGSVCSISSLTCSRDTSVSMCQKNESDVGPIIVSWDTEMQSDMRLDPRLKSKGGSSLGSCSAVRSSSVVEPQLAVDTDSLSNAHGTRLMGELDGLQCEVSTAGSLDSRIDTFASHIDAFPVNEKVKDEVNRIMSGWEADVNNAEISVQSREGNDSDVDDFIIIDDDDDDSNDDDSELVIDLSSTDAELIPELSMSRSMGDNSPVTKTSSGCTVKYDMARNVQPAAGAESTIDHCALSDVDVQSLAETVENCHVVHQQERHLSVSNDSSVASHQNKSVEHSSSKLVKHGRAEGHRRTMALESNNRWSSNTSHHTVETKRAVSLVSSSTAVFKPDRDYLIKASQCGSAACKRETDGYSTESYASSSTQNAHKIPMSSSMYKQHLKMLMDKDCDKSQCNLLKSDANVDSTSCLSVFTCLASLANVSTSNLGKLERHMEAEVKTVEQKAALCKQYACSLDNLDESEKQQLVTDGLAEPAVVSEFAIELRLLSVLRDIDKAAADMAKIKSQFDPMCLSSSLENKYDQLERTYGNLIVCRDWYYTRMHRLRRYYKSRCLLTLPDDLRFSCEIGKCVSVEGVPLILNDCTISLHHCKRLAALLILTKRLCGSCPATLTQDVLQKLGWLHEERKTLLNAICCSSPQKIDHCIECLCEKLAVYKYVTLTVKKIICFSLSDYYSTLSIYE